MDTWTRHFEMAGLTDVSATPVVSEAAVIVGTKPWLRHIEAPVRNGIPALRVVNIVPRRRRLHDFARTGERGLADEASGSRPSR
jgi:hypothetical protein